MPASRVPSLFRARWAGASAPHKPPCTCPICKCLLPRLRVVVSLPWRAEHAVVGGEDADLPPSPSVARAPDVPPRNAWPAPQRSCRFSRFLPRVMGSTPCLGAGSVLRQFWACRAAGAQTGSSAGHVQVSPHHSPKLLPHWMDLGPCCHQLTMDVRVYFWTPGSILGTQESVLCPLAAFALQSGLKWGG